MNNQLARTHSRSFSKILLIGLVTLMCLTAVIGWAQHQRFGLDDSNVEQTDLVSLSKVRDRAGVGLQLYEDGVVSKTLSVEVVNTEESITQGLSGRSSIGADGMLFVLPSREIATFWMKDMLFPLDLVWIDGSLVVGVTANVLAPAPTATSLPTYASPGSVTAVLELPAGRAEQLQIKAGSLFKQLVITD